MPGLVIHDEQGNIQCSYSATNYDLDQLARDNTPPGLAALRIEGHHEALTQPHKWYVQGGALVPKPDVAPTKLPKEGNLALASKGGQPQS